MFQSPGPIAFQLGPISVHWYGILIVCGIVAAFSYALYEAKRRGLSQKIIDDMSLPVVLGGIIGARLYYVLFNLSEYAQKPLDAFAIWKGGLAIHGAILGGGLVFYLYMKHKKVNPLEYVDVVIPGLLVAQAIGRWGNFFNSEAFGNPTNLPWGVFIPTDLRPIGMEDFAFFHPTFLYESLWNLIGFALLVWLSRKHKFMASPGSIFAVYLIYYSIGRFWIEQLRTDSLWLGPLKAAQVVSVCALIGGIVLLKYAKSRRKVNG